jgi:hypothetical protein
MNSDDNMNNNINNIKDATTRNGSLREDGEVRK